MPVGMSFPILRLPTEVRLIIYREPWTLLDSGIGGNSDTGSGSDSQDVLIDRANQQLSTITTIQNLSITCQKICSELVDTYST